MAKVVLSFIFSCCVIVTSCTTTSTQPNPQNETKVREKLIDINKERIAQENDQIESYINRMGYTMQTTETGLRYKIIEQGKGDKPKWMSEVKLNYKLNLLDGTYCYSSDSSGVLQIKLGQSNEPTGLQEGVLKINKGGKALLIVPSYLAYGLTGDGDKITGAQSLIYTIELMDLK